MKKYDLWVIFTLFFFVILKNLKCNSWSNPRNTFNSNWKMTFQMFWESISKGCINKPNSRQYRIDAANVQKLLQPNNALFAVRKISLIYLKHYTEISDKFLNILTNLMVLINYYYYASIKVEVWDFRIHLNIRSITKNIFRES